MRPSSRLDEAVKFFWSHFASFGPRRSNTSLAVPDYAIAEHSPRRLTLPFDRAGSCLMM